ncbi:hypothetical protein Tco_0906440 [Tanacetum coccineum]|uniref:Uncharacterized protein n=1 Tax=Tanacetum coccineum TaxID=301880 RepID=A0ABQ5CGU3_9ASTR
MSFLTMLDEITLESLTEEQFECFIEYYRENYPKDYKSDLENLKEVYKMINGGVEYPRTQNASPGSTFVGETLRKSDQLHQTFEKSSIAMTLMVKMPKCMTWLDDEPIGDLDTIEDKAKNPSPQSTPRLPSFKVYTLLVTHLEEVKETIGIPMEVEPLDHMKLEDLRLNTNTHDLFVSSKGFPSVGEPEP